MLEAGILGAGILMWMLTGQAWDPNELRYGSGALALRLKPEWLIGEPSAFLCQDPATGRVAPPPTLQLLGNLSALPPARAS